jgi:hypothetical protein
VAKATQPWRSNVAVIGLGRLGTACTLALLDEPGPAPAGVELERGASLDAACLARTARRSGRRRIDA